MSRGSLDPTGTTDRIAPRLHMPCRARSAAAIATHLPTPRTSVRGKNSLISGSGGETRTHNQRINSSNPPVRLVPRRPLWCGPVRKPTLLVRPVRPRAVWYGYTNGYTTNPGYWSTTPDPTS
jgi:hypothetical protein